MAVQIGNHRWLSPNTSPSNGRIRSGGPASPRRSDLRIQRASHGISDGKLFASFFRDADKRVIGGISGWTWAKPCFIGHLFVPAELRKQGYGTRGKQLMLKQSTRGCDQIVLRTHDFQALQFYIKLGFAVIEGVQTIRSVTKKSR